MLWFKINFAKLLFYYIQKHNFDNETAISTFTFFFESLPKIGLILECKAPRNFKSSMFFQFWLNIFFETIKVLMDFILPRILNGIVKISREYHK